MPKLKLTDPFIRNHPAPEKRLEIYDKHTPGLAVRITKKGSKSFVYRYRFNDQVKRFTIGRYPKMSLAEARDEVSELSYKVNHGTDPLEEKKAKKSKPKPKKFEYLVKRFKKQHLSNLKESTQRTYGNRIDSKLLPAFKGMAVKNISRGVIMELLEDIAFEQDSPTNSNRVRAILSSMFSFAVQREIAEYNPVSTIKPLGKEVKRDRVLDKSEIKALWKSFSEQREPVRSALMMLLLLGQRKGETCRMKWEDVQSNVWTIPKEETKAFRTHRLPLPTLAIEIIESLDNDSAYIFESRRYEGQPIKWLHSAFKRAAKQAKIADVRIHDLRRTAATYMAEMGTDRTILGKVLNHKGLSGDSQVTARYDRYGYMDEKRTALNRWANKLQQIVTGTETKITKIG